MAAPGLLISYMLPFYVQLFLLLCYQVHFPLNPGPLVMIYKKKFHIMCCMVYSSPEKTKSRVTFFFPTPLTNWADVGLKDPHWTDKANSMCRMSDQH